MPISYRPETLSYKWNTKEIGKIVFVWISSAIISMVYFKIPLPSEENSFSLIIIKCLDRFRDFKLLRTSEKMTHNTVSQNLPHIRLMEANKIFLNRF